MSNIVRWWYWRTNTSCSHWTFRHAERRLFCLTFYFFQCLLNLCAFVLLALIELDQWLINFILIYFLGKWLEHRHFLAWKFTRAIFTILNVYDRVETWWTFLIFFIFLQFKIAPISLILNFLGIASMSWLKFPRVITIAHAIYPII